jgi:hypothetical protein
MLTPGQDHDLTGAEPLLENANPGAIIADKATRYDKLARNYLAAVQLVATIILLN